MTSATGAPVRRSSSAGLSRKTPFACPAAAQISLKRNSSRSIKVTGGKIVAADATYPTTNDSGSTPKPNHTQEAGPAEKIGPHAAQESGDSADEVAPASFAANDSAPSPRLHFTCCLCF